MTREETINNLYNARDIIYKAYECANEMNEVKSQYLNHRDYCSYSAKSMGKWTKIGMAILLIISCSLTVNWIGTLIQSFQWGGTVAQKIVFTVLMLIFTGIDIFLVWMVVKLRRKYIDSKNKKISTENEAIDERNNQLTQIYNQKSAHLAEIQNRYGKEVAGWYPNDYATCDAVDFFISAYENYRADTIKEAVDKYEEELQRRREDLHHRTIEAQNQQNIENQRIMQQQLSNLQYQQEVGNALAMGQLYTSMRQLNATNELYDLFKNKGVKVKL